MPGFQRSSGDDGMELATLALIGSAFPRQRLYADTPGRAFAEMIADGVAGRGIMVVEYAASAAMIAMGSRFRHSCA